MILHLGVVDVPYSQSGEKIEVQFKTKQGKKVKFTATTGNSSTGDVAQILEDKYHVMELFFEELGYETVQAALEHSAKNAIEDMFAGASPDSVSLTMEATEELQTAFRIFIDQKELDGVEPGVPTQASLDGVNHRKKNPYSSRNKSRPSFKDTGLYQASMRAWVDD